MTPLRDDGRALDEDAFGRLLEFYAGAGLEALLVLGTTGKEILLDRGERRRRRSGGRRGGGDRAAVLRVHAR